ncbi:PAS domain-containing sensor histidine kinase [Nostoc sp. FACHB-87]|uniref:PAS domain-containing sensor histidine kinase n=1 Tax=Nostocaceae TaxID=1162 RepID=UPI001689DD62|nr:MULTISPECIES: PAS domain-containing sensor histidine kinase [Nostocaceae]MBD2453544.1 PAS domain-containing sensor histidine kinase [Nostoc sp. FACHB-87]MBD2475669.1 PAS domain-containing sensor histidine kinase [Anabaena sp. FACHB-83]
MSLNQRSLWHQTHTQQDTLSASPARLELVPERTSDLELYTADMLRRTQAELHWYRSLYEHTPAIYLSVNAAGIILSVNQFGANLLGYKPEELIKTSVFNLLELSDRQRLSETFIELFSAVYPNHSIKAEYRLHCPDSKITQVKTTLKILPDGEYPEKSPVILMVCEEVSQATNQTAKQVQLAEMESLTHLKEEFLSTVSHELRTPLTNMKMAIQMLGIALQPEQNFVQEMAKPPTERSKAARYFAILDNECEREINLINNFLDLQRLDSNAQPWVLETIQVQQWLRRVVELFHARNRGICKQKIHLRIAPHLPPLVCDPFSLERIFIELLTNACKFSPPEAEITVAVALNCQNMQFQVINAGVEIPSSELPHIFDKFYRIPSNDPWKQGGTGLGLALVQKLIKQLEGTIEVDSRSNRTCFMVQLPLQRQG